jgi:hypothetical protein
LEGKLLSAWVDELHRATQPARTFTGAKTLDLADLSFADAAGVALLRELTTVGGFTITACSHFVQELLQTVQP